MENNQNPPIAGELSLEKKAALMANYLASDHQALSGHTLKLATEYWKCFALNKELTEQAEKMLVTIRNLVGVAQDLDNKLTALEAIQKGKK
jgi:hypothetical protein